MTPVTTHPVLARARKPTRALASDTSARESRLASIGRRWRWFLYPALLVALAVGIYRDYGASGVI